MESSGTTLLRSQDEERGETRTVETGRPYLEMTLVITGRLEGGRGRERGREEGEMEERREGDRERER